MPTKKHTSANKNTSFQSKRSTDTTRNIELVVRYEQGGQLSESELECVRKQYAYLAAHKNTEAIYKLGLFHLKEMQRHEEGSAAHLQAKNAALSNFKWAAKEAHPDANQQLGEGYRTGSALVAKDLDLSISYYAKAAKLFATRLRNFTHPVAKADPLSSPLTVDLKALKPLVAASRLKLHAAVTATATSLDIPIRAEKIEPLLPEDFTLEAEKELDDYINQLTKSARVEFILGSLYEKKGEKSAAEKEGFDLADDAYKRAAIAYDKLERAEAMRLGKTYVVEEDEKSGEEKLVQAEEGDPTEIARKLHIDPLSAQAHHEIADLYKEGDEEISVDLKRAFQHYKIAADQGSSLAGYQIALIYDQNTPEVPCDPPQLISYMETYADEGDSDAQHFLGDCYRIGKYVAPDAALAMAYYKKAASQGHLKSKYELGVQYEKEGDFKAAFDSYVSAPWLPQSGLALGSCYEYGKGTAVDVRKAVEFYIFAAKGGEVDALLPLGNLYLHGKEGLAKNVQLAFSYINQAAEKGVLPALYPLAFCYMHGLGVAKNPEKAWNLLGRAERAGYSPAVELMSFVCRQLGDMDRATAEGKAKIFQLLAKEEMWSEENETPVHRAARLHSYYGIERSFQAFIAMHTENMAQGKQDSIGVLRALHVAGKHVAQDPKLVACYEDPTAQQNASSLCCIGEYYFRHAQDFKEAVRWYKEAAILGHAWALLRLEQMQFEGKYPVHEEVDFPHLRSIVTQVATDTEGLIELGKYCIQKLLGKYNELAFALFQRAETLGSVEGAYYLGVCNINGWGTAKNVHLGLMLYKQSADKGHPLAAYILALHLICSPGAEGDMVETGLLYLELAEKKNSSDAIQVMSAARAKLGDRDRNTPQGKAAFIHILQHEITWPHLRTAPPTAQAVPAPAEAPTAQEMAQEEKDTRPVPVAVPEQKGTSSTTASAAVAYLPGSEEFALGNDYWNGTGGKNKDLQQAVGCYKKAANLGHPQALLRLGHVYGLGSEEASSASPQRKSSHPNASPPRKSSHPKKGWNLKKDLEKSRGYYARLKESTDPLVLVELGDRYREGTHGAEKNMRLAFTYYKKAADLGHVRAAYWVGYSYRIGEGVKLDINRAMHYWRWSAAQGYPRAIYILAYELIIEETDVLKTREGLNYLKQAVHMQYDGAVQLMSLIGAQIGDPFFDEVRLLESLNRVKKEWPLSMDAPCNSIVPPPVTQPVYQEMQPVEAAPACPVLAITSIESQGSVPAEEKKEVRDVSAAELFEQGNQYREGREETAQDYVAAFACYQQAAERGDLRAAYYRACAYLEGQGVVQDKEKGLQELQQVADQKYPPALVALGLYHAAALGVEVGAMREALIQLQRDTERCWSPVSAAVNHTEAKTDLSQTGRDASSLPVPRLSVFSMLSSTGGGTPENGHSLTSS